MMKNSNTDIENDSDCDNFLFNIIVTVRKILIRHRYQYVKVVAH